MNTLSVPFRVKAFATLIPAAFLLAACGGGGSGDSAGDSATTSSISSSTSSGGSSVASSSDVATAVVASQTGTIDVTTTDNTATATSVAATATPTATSPDAAANATFAAAALADASTTTDMTAETATVTPAVSTAASTSDTVATIESATATSCSASSSTFGTFDKPFAANSPWNSHPVSPVFGTDVIPTSAYFPVVAAGAYSTQGFKASASDPAVTVKGNSSAGIWDPDMESYRSGVTIPHWPAGVVPATGTDGHAEIVDTSTGIIHSFWQLKQVNGNWTASQYAWTSLTGRGFGDGAHYMQGARSAGVSTLGGLIRIAEVNDGDTTYHHALAMSMTYNGLSKSPTYVFPATSADSDAATSNSGPFPLGSLMMLPPAFDISKIQSTALRKVAQTLKTYGAYAVDRNVGTPFGIYVENGSGYNLMPGGWNNGVANDLQAIRAGLRRVTSASSWVDGNGISMAQLDTNVNILSMRGAFTSQKGPLVGNFDTWKQAIAFAANPNPIVETNLGGRAYAGVSWTAPQPGVTYHLTATTTTGAAFKLTLDDMSTGKASIVFNSGAMTNGQSVDFTWPNKKGLVVVTVASNSNGGLAGNVSATLVRKVTGQASATCTQ